MRGLLQLLRRVQRRGSVAAIMGLALTTGVAGAYFAGALSGASNTTAVAASLPQANTPTVTATGNAVHVGWNQNTVAGSLLASYSGGGYTVQRYASTGGAAIIPNSSCAGTVSGGGASLNCTDTGVPPGQWVYKITPVLNNWTGAQSAASTTVTTGVSTDTVTAVADPTTVGTAVTYTATVTGGGATPSGTATFKDGGVAIAGCGTAGAVTLSGGVATCTVTYATVGSHTITAPYSGDSNYSSAAGNSLTETVGPGTATDTVTSSANPSNPNHAVTYTATVTGGGTTPTGTVTFKDGGVAIATCGTSGTVTLSSGVATCTVTYTTAGSHSITAAYSGDSNYTAAAGNTVSQSVVLLTPTDTVTSAQNPTTIGHALTYTATVTGAGSTPTGTVTFKDGGVAIAGCGTAGAVTLSAGVATCSVTYASAGSHTITAAYSGDSNYIAAAGNTLTETVLSTSSTTVAANYNPVAANASVTFTATVTGSGATPTGSVTFQSGGIAISGCGSSGTVTLSGGVATCTVSFATAGSRSITAVYGGDSNYAGSTSSALSETVSADTNSVTQAAPSESGKSAKVVFSGTTTDANTVTVYYCTGTLSSCTSATAAGSVTITPTGSGSSYTWTSAAIQLSKTTAYTSQAYQTDPLGATLASAVQQFTT